MSAVSRIFVTLMLLILALPCAAMASAQKFTVLPIEINGPAKYQYLSKGIQSMLISRLNWKGHFEAVDAGSLKAADAPKPGETKKAIEMMESVGANFLVWGSTTIMGDQATVDLNVQDAEGKSWPKHSSMPISELIPGLESMAKSVTAEVFRRPGSDDDKKSKAKAAPVAPANPELMFAETGRSTAPEGINPRFKYEGMREAPGRWRSQSFKFRSRGFDIADIDGDGKNEVAIMGEGMLMVGRYNDNRLDVLAEYSLPSRLNAIRLSSFDLNRDGNREIILSAYMGNKPSSRIFELQGSELIEKLDNINMHLNVVRMPPEYQPTLIGQKKGHGKLFRPHGVREVDMMGGEPVLSRKVALPEFSNVYNFCYLPEQNGTWAVVRLDDSGHLKLYESESEDPMSETQDTYNKSAIGLEETMMPAGMGPQKHDDKIESYYYVPLRLSAYSLAKDGKYELLAVKDITTAGQIMESYRTYSQGEIHSLYFDGVGLNLYWKTRRIKGTIVDYTVNDIDNDGQMDLCVLVNTYPGALGIKYIKTMVISFPLSIDKHGDQTQ